MSQVIRIPYDVDQMNAFIDSCIYGSSYGIEASSHDYIQQFLKEQNISNEISGIELDDQSGEFVVSLK